MLSHKFLVTENSKNCSVCTTTKALSWYVFWCAAVSGFLKKYLCYFQEDNLGLRKITYGLYQWYFQLISYSFKLQQVLFKFYKFCSFLQVLFSFCHFYKFCSSSYYLCLNWLTIHADDSSSRLEESSTSSAWILRCLQSFNSHYYWDILWNTSHWAIGIPIKISRRGFNVLH